MASIGATSASSRQAAVTTPNIQNITVTAATEVVVNIPANSRRYTVQMRDVSGFQVRYTATVPADSYWTVECGNTYEEPSLGVAVNYTLYITPDRDGTLEVLSWS